MLKSVHCKDITNLSMTFPNAMPSYWDKLFLSDKLNFAVVTDKTVLEANPSLTPNYPLFLPHPFSTTLYPLLCFIFSFLSTSLESGNLCPCLNYDQFLRKGQKSDEGDPLFSALEF